MLISLYPANVFGWIPLLWITNPRLSKSPPFTPHRLTATQSPDIWQPTTTQISTHLQAANNRNNKIEDIYPDRDLDQQEATWVLESTSLALTWSNHAPCVARRWLSWRCHRTSCCQCGKQCGCQPRWAWDRGTKRKEWDKLERERLEKIWVLGCPLMNVEREKRNFVRIKRKKKKKEGKY